MHEYRYRANFIEAVDGDTVDVEVDLGFQIRTELRLRIKDIDTPELRKGSEESKAKAREARDRVTERLEPYREGFRLTVQTYKTRTGSDRRTFGRYVATVHIPEPQINGRSDTTLAEVLVSEGLARRV